MGNDILDNLNPEQREAVKSTEGCIRVIAGAGSGKTRALAARFAYLVNEIGIMPSNILCATFTNKAANEMKQRIRRLIGDRDTGYVSTFHAFCVTVLQEDIHAVQYPKSFLVLDNSDIDDMLRLIYEERGLTLRDMTFSRAREMIEVRKLDKEPDYYRLMIALGVEELRQKYLEADESDDIIFYGYLYAQKKCFGLDYNDLIKYVLYIFEEQEAILRKWQERLEYIMVDEYQDIDGLQYSLLRQLCGYHWNLFVVGDPDQTIYTWRGANVRYILDFDKDFPNTKTIMMMRNYRSTPQIIRAANALISRNQKRMSKDLIPLLPEGGPVVYHHASTAADEAGWIASEIRELEARGMELSDAAVLYRSHFLTRTIEEVFIREEIPYVLYSGVQFFSRMEIKDTIAYLRLIAFKDDLSFLRAVNVPKRNIGSRRIKFLQDYANANQKSLWQAFRETWDREVFQNTQAREFLYLIEHFTAASRDLPVSELLTRILDQSGYEAMLRTEGNQDRLDNLAELKQAVYEYETTSGEESTLEEYLRQASLLTNTDAVTGRNKVKLMTVHTAKGLEFPYVFLCGMDEGIFPSKKTLTRDQMEEERRLAFVAFTRARKGLHITDAEGRNLDGSYRYPSRFIFDVGDDLLKYTVTLDDSLIAETRLKVNSSEKMMDLTENGPRFNIGDRVSHHIMGAGFIQDLDMDRQAYIIQFEGLPTTRRISFAAKLNRA